MREYDNSGNVELREYLFKLRRKELKSRGVNLQLRAQVRELKHTLPHHCDSSQYHLN
ncbi:uncharacterized protein G2W53_041123 [Senna tora]|uniref:Uncharacterized protein n=1 Tax=Senna tora TaxID=362788 RepID=A0A834VYG9_9FABA|nr:uncharacterized protein G2W53_041123 [Senna tora]